MSSNFFSGLVDLDTVASWFEWKEKVLPFLEWLAPYSTVVSLLLIVGIVYCFLRIDEIVHKTKHHDVVESEGHGKKSEGENPGEKRWERVLTHLNSDRESDWRLAVLEADVILDEMVSEMGYHGDSLGERLKGVEKSDFTTLDEAWEAHAVRNKIAHEGATFPLTEREARRVIGLYEKVFNEFHHI